MTKKTTKKTFKMNGWTYEYNEPMTSNWGWPDGRKGERVRILKKQMQQLLKERDAFKTPFEEVDEPAEAPQEAPSEPTEADDDAGREPEGVEPENATEGTGEAEEDGEPEHIVAVSLPTDGHTARSLANLINLVYTRADLINKALGTQFSVSDELIGGTLLLEKDSESLLAGKKNDLLGGIAFKNNKITFTAVLPESRIQAFMALAGAMNGQALTQKRIRAKKANEENEKYAMRIWLTRLGLNGPEYKKIRKDLLQNLSGHTAFSTEAERQRWMDRHATAKGKEEA